MVLLRVGIRDKLSVKIDEKILNVLMCGWRGYASRFCLLGGVCFDGFSHEFSELGFASAL